MEQETVSSELTQQQVSKPTGYEFTALQNSTIQLLGERMKFIGLLNLLFAGLVGLGGIFILFQSLPQALVAFLEVAFFGFMGFWTYQGAASFIKIVQTRGSDISHLMNALEDLRKIYNLQFWLMVFMLGMIVLGIVVVLILA